MRDKEPVKRGKVDGNPAREKVIPSVKQGNPLNRVWKVLLVQTRKSLSKAGKSPHCK